MQRQRGGGSEGLGARACKAQKTQGPCVRKLALGPARLQECWPASVCSRVCARRPPGSPAAWHLLARHLHRHEAAPQQSTSDYGMRSRSSVHCPLCAEGEPPHLGGSTARCRVVCEMWSRATCLLSHCAAPLLTPTLLPLRSFASTGPSGPLDGPFSPIYSTMHDACSLVESID
jgi:hypothetical protein